MAKNEQQQLIGNFLRGKLDREQENKLLSWVKASSANKTVFQEQQELLSKELTYEKDLKYKLQWNRLYARINGSKQKNRILFSRIGQVAAIAAAFVLGIFITAISISSLDFSHKVGSNTQEITTPYGARTSFTLPDGSKVWLNSGSTLTFPHQFADNRPVSLTGEAFFEVKKGENPFIVSTKYGDVEVLGTSFNVSAFDEEQFQTTLVSGLVKVKGSKDGEELRLTPGYQASETKNKLKIRKVDTRLFTSWKDGKLIFENEYLPNVVRRLERWYNIHIDLDDDPRLRKIHFTGTIEMESFPEVLELLKTTSSINYTYNESIRTIKITKQ